jgi:hypothetical protein
MSIDDSNDSTWNGGATASATAAVLEPAVPTPQEIYLQELERQYRELGGDAGAGSDWARIFTDGALTAGDKTALLTARNMTLLAQQYGDGAAAAAKQAAFFENLAQRYANSPVGTVFASEAQQAAYVNNMRRAANVSSQANALTKTRVRVDFCGSDQKVHSDPGFGSSRRRSRWFGLLDSTRG